MTTFSYRHVSADWQLLWQENEYRWKPVFASATVPAPAWVSSVTVWDGNSSGGGNSPGSGCSSSWTSLDWAVGTPGLTGEVAVIPKVLFQVLSNSEHPFGSHLNRYANTPYDTILVGDSTVNPASRSIAMDWSKPATANAAQDRPRLGVTKINSVYWESADSCTNAIQLGPNPSANGGGMRCFPEQSLPGGIAHDKILAMCHLVAPIPTGMEGTVYLDWFDPNNPIGSTIKPTGNGPGVRDNHGYLFFWSPDPEFGRVKFAGGTQLQWMTCELTSDHPPQSPHNPDQVIGQGAHAGDNYIIAAHPNAGIAATYQFKNDGKTLSYFDGSGMTTLPTKLRSDMLTVWRTLNVERDVCYWPSMPQSGDLRAPLDGLVEEQLARACVVTKEYTPNPNPGPVIDDAISLDDAIDYAGIGRDITGNCKAFWTVRIVTSSKLIQDDSLGYFHPTKNGISIIYENLLEYKNKWNLEEWQFKDCVRQTVLHEIAHCLIDPDDRVVYPSYTFTDDDIRQLQKHSRAMYII